MGGGVCPSVCLSVRLSDSSIESRRLSMQFSPRDFGFSRSNFLRQFTGITLSYCFKWDWGRWKVLLLKFLLHSSETVWDIIYDFGCYWSLMWSGDVRPGPRGQFLAASDSSRWPRPPVCGRGPMAWKTFLRYTDSFSTWKDAQQSVGKPCIFKM